VLGNWFSLCILYVSVVKSSTFGNLGGGRPFAKIAADLAKPSAKKHHFIGKHAKPIAKIAILSPINIEGLITPPPMSNRRQLR
jgi:hypothetical protein